MKKFLKMVGFTALYLGIFLLVAFIVGLTLRTARNIGWIETETLKEIVAKYDLVIMSIQCILATGAYALVFKLRKQSMKQFCKMQRLDTKSTFYSFVVALSMGIFSTSLIELTYVSSKVPELGETVTFFMGRGNIIMAIMCSVLIVPAFEELLFRGLVFNEMRKAMPFALALIIQSLLYALVQPNLPAMVFGFIGGILFALGYVWTESLWSPVIMQTASCFFMTVFRRTSINEIIGAQPDIVKVILAVLSVTAIVYSMLQIRKQGQTNKVQPTNTAAI